MSNINLSNLESNLSTLEKNFNEVGSRVVLLSSSESNYQKILEILSHLDGLNYQVKECLYCIQRELEELRQKVEGA